MQKPQKVRLRFFLLNEHLKKKKSQMDWRFLHLKSSYINCVHALINIISSNILLLLLIINLIWSFSF